MEITDTTNTKFIHNIKRGGYANLSFTATETNCKIYRLSIRLNISRFVEITTKATISFLVSSILKTRCIDYIRITTKNRDIAILREDNTDKVLDKQIFTRSQRVKINYSFYLRVLITYGQYKQ